MVDSRILMELMSLAPGSRENKVTMVYLLMYVILFEIDVCFVGCLLCLSFQDLFVQYIFIITVVLCKERHTIFS